MTLPLSSPFTSNTKVTKVQLDQLVTAINTINTATPPNPLPQHYMTNTAGTSIANSTDQTVTWTLASSAQMGSISAGVRTISVKGYYMCMANLAFTSAIGAGVYVHSQILVNGGAVAVSNATSISGHNTTVAPSVGIPLNVGDTVAITISQNTGSAQTLATAAGANFWSLAWVGYL